MKKLLLFAMILMSVLPAAADLNGDGYYRVQNAQTKRYAYLIDNKGKFDISTGTYDVEALDLYKNFLRASSDPASVFYINITDNSGYMPAYDIAGQGTSLYGFLGVYVKMLTGKVYDGIPSWYIFGQRSGGSKYLGDAAYDTDDEAGVPSLECKGDNRLWYFHNLDASSADSYFGIAPTMTAEGKYYYPFFAAFPFSASSQGVKFYTVSKVDPQYGVVVIKEASGIIPAATPVIVECANPLAADNRLNIGGTPNADVSGNLLSGVYFDSAERNHVNQVAYDKTRMRSLSVVDGKLKFVAGDYATVPRNQAYLELTDAAAQGVGEYAVIKDTDYQAYIESLSKHNPDGWYRMQNVSTGRYAAVTDNSGSASDFAGVSLYSGILRAASDPATVLQMTKPEGAGVFDRELSSQSASLSKMFGSYLNINPASTAGNLTTYYAQLGGTYLGDAAAAGDSDASLSAGASGNANQWTFLPLETSASGNYFGVVPSQTAGGKYYAAFMAGFPFKTASPGMKVYIIKKIDSDLAMMVIKPVEGVIAAGTPVIIECAGPLASDNLLEVGANGAAADVAGNLLTAVYFDSNVAGHDNRTPYDAAAMRSLSVANGALSMAAASAAYVPRNQAYISLSQEEQKSVTSYALVDESTYSSKLQELAGAIGTDGFYRVRNAETGRRLYLVDGKGTLNATSNSDLGAFRLVSDALRANSDPASVFELSTPGSADSAFERDLMSQGTSFRAITKSYVKMIPDGDAVKMFAVKNGTKKYLGDTDASVEDAPLSAEASESVARWHLDAVDSSSDSEWFGVTPTVTAGGKYYATLMAGFPVAAKSAGVKLYIVSNLDANYKVAVLKEMTGEVPAGTPIVVECAGPLATENRLAVGEGGSEADTKGNYLKGVWFDSSYDGHTNGTAYDSESMRILTSDGDKLTFTKSDISKLPANQAYLLLTGMRYTGIPEFEAMTEDEYFNLKGGVEVITPTTVVDVYSVDGVLLRQSILRSEVQELGKGIFIVKAGASTDKVYIR